MATIAEADREFGEGRYGVAQDSLLTLISAAKQKALDPDAPVEACLELGEALLTRLRHLRTRPRDWQHTDDSCALGPDDLEREEAVAKAAIQAHAEAVNAAGEGEPLLRAKALIGLGEAEMQLGGGPCGKLRKADDEAATRRGERAMLDAASLLAREDDDEAREILRRAWLGAARARAYLRLYGDALKALEQRKKVEGSTDGDAEAEALTDSCAHMVEAEMEFEEAQANKNHAEAAAARYEAGLEALEGLGDFHHGKALLKEALAAEERSRGARWRPNREHARWLCDMRAVFARCYFREGRAGPEAIERAISEFEIARKHAHDAGDPTRESKCLTNLGTAWDELATIDRLGPPPGTRVDGWRRPVKMCNALQLTRDAFQKAQAARAVAMGGRAAGIERTTVNGPQTQVASKPPATAGLPRSKLVEVLAADEAAVAALENLEYFLTQRTRGAPDGAPAAEADRHELSRVSAELARWKGRLETDRGLLEQAPEEEEAVAEEGAKGKSKAGKRRARRGDEENAEPNSDKPRKRAKPTESDEEEQEEETEEEGEGRKKKRGRRGSGRGRGRGGRGRGVTARAPATKGRAKKEEEEEEEEEEERPAKRGRGGARASSGRRKAQATPAREEEGGHGSDRASEGDEGEESEPEVVPQPRRREPPAAPAAAPPPPAPPAAPAPAPTARAPAEPPPPPPPAAPAPPPPARAPPKPAAPAPPTPAPAPAPAAPAPAAPARTTPAPVPPKPAAPVRSAAAVAPARPAPVPAAPARPAAAPAAPARPAPAPAAAPSQAPGAAGSAAEVASRWLNVKCIPPAESGLNPSTLRVGALGPAPLVKDLLRVANSKVHLKYPSLMIKFFETPAEDQLDEDDLLWEVVEPRSEVRARLQRDTAAGDVDCGE